MKEEETKKERNEKKWIEQVKRESSSFFCDKFWNLYNIHESLNWLIINQLGSFKNEQ
jgi:hypothetical protein